MRSKTLPTVPGYYGLRNYSIKGIEGVDEGPCVVLVEHDDNDETQPLECRWPGSELNIALSEFTTAEWRGPFTATDLSLEEIKTAFWNTFSGAGELWFPDPARESGSPERELTERWELFVSKLPKR